MLDWDTLERELVAAYTARVRELRRRFEADLGAIGRAEDLAAIEAAIERALGRPTPRKADRPAAPPPPHIAPPAPVDDPWDAAPPPPPPPLPPAAPAAPARPPRSATANAPAAGGSPAQDALRGLAELSRALERLPVALPEEATAFLGRAGLTFDALAEPDRAGERGTKVLTDCVKLLDGLAADLPALETSGEVESAARAAADAIAAVCERERGCAFFPSATVSPAEARARFGPQSVEALALPSAKAAGALLRTIERGLLVDGRPKRKARVLESAGREDPLGAIYLGARAALARLPAEIPARARIDAGRALDRLAAESLDLASDDDRSLSLRYALNALVPVEAASAGALAPALRPIRDALQALGVYELDLRIGDRFDERFPPDRYERRTMPSRRPEGTISEVIQPGFMNRQGICVQRAVVGVSAGK